MGQHIDLGNRPRPADPEHADDKQVNSKTREAYQGLDAKRIWRSNEKGADEALRVYHTPCPPVNQI